MDKRAHAAVAGVLPPAPPGKRDTPLITTTTVTTTAQQTFTFCGGEWDLPTATASAAAVGQASASASAAAGIQYGVSASIKPSASASGESFVSYLPLPSAISSFCSILVFRCSMGYALLIPAAAKRRSEPSVTYDKVVTDTVTYYPTATCSNAPSASAATPSGAKCYCKPGGTSSGMLAEATSSAPLVSPTPSCTATSCGHVGDAPSEVVTASEAWKRDKGVGGGVSVGGQYKRTESTDDLVECDCGEPECVTTVIPGIGTSSGMLAMSTASSALIEGPSSCAAGASCGHVG